MCRHFDPLFDTLGLEHYNYQSLQNSIFLDPYSLFASFFSGPIFSGQQHTPMDFQAKNRFENIVTTKLNIWPRPKYVNMSCNHKPGSLGFKYLTHHCSTALGATDCLIECKQRWCMPSNLILAAILCLKLRISLFRLGLNKYSILNSLS